MDTIKRIAGILDRLLPHLPLLIKWNQIVVENLKKFMDIGFWQSPTSNLKKKY